MINNYILCPKNTKLLKNNQTLRVSQYRSYNHTRFGLQLKLYQLQCQQMINNYLDYEYQPCHRVYSHDTYNNSIYLGDINAALDLQYIKTETIKTVVTAATGLQHVVYDASIDHIVYPLLDMKSQNISKYFNQFYELIQNKIGKGNVLVHCAAGISRSATLVISYLMRKKCWGFKQAIQFVRQSRPTVCPNLGFERQLKEYQVALNRQAEFGGFERRHGSKTSEERKHVAFSTNNHVLPEIGMMGRTQLKPKILDLFAIESQKGSRQQSRQLSKHLQKKDLQFYGTKRIAFKTKKSKSIPDKPISNSPVPQKHDYPIGDLKMSMPIQKIQDVMIRRLNLNDKKIPTQRQIRMKPLHKLAYY